MSSRERFVSSTTLKSAAPGAARQPAAPLDLNKLQHELQVHQIELETQNEELRRAQVELEESRDRYHELYDLAPVAYVTLDRSGRILESNLTTAALLDVPRAELIGRAVQGFLTAEDADRFHRYLGAVSRSTEKQGDDFDLHTVSGRVVRTRIEGVSVPPLHERPPTCRCVIIDLSLLRVAQDEQRKSEERFRQLAESIEDVFYVRDRDGRFCYLSPAFERIFGLSPEPLYEGTAGWSRGVDSEDRERLELAEAALLADGHAFDVGYRVKRRGEVRFLRHRAYPVRDRSSLVTRTVGVVHDVTVERQLEDQLRHAQKMEAVGALASGVAHDFNNVLQSILGLGWMALKKDARPSDVREHVESIVRTARRGGAVTGRLTSFARRGRASAGVRELDAMVKEAASLLPHLLMEHIEVRVELGAPGVVICAEEMQIEQILMNLAGNARDAMPGGGTIRIETFVVGESVRLSVSDNGAGMDDATRTRVFEPFFTTKGVGRGTGLGLASVQALAQQLGGHVECASELGNGSTFVIELPIGPPQEAVAVTTVISPKLTGTVLLVEDEPIVRMTIRQYLEELGLEVVEASNGEEARRRFVAADGSIRLLVTDVVMPGMLGSVLAGLLQASLPELRVLLMTANPQGFGAERDRPHRALLRKPFNKEDLASTLGELLS